MMRAALVSLVGHACLALSLHAQMPAQLLSRTTGLGARCDREVAGLANIPASLSVYNADYGEIRSSSRGAWLLVDSTGAVQRALVMWGALEDSPRLTMYSALVAHQPGGALFGALQTTTMLKEGASARPDPSTPPVTDSLPRPQADSVLAFAGWLFRTLCLAPSPH